MENLRKAYHSSWKNLASYYNQTENRGDGCRKKTTKRKKCHDWEVTERIEKVIFHVLEKLEEEEFRINLAMVNINSLSRNCRIRIPFQGMAHGSTFKQWQNSQRKLYKIYFSTQAKKTNNQEVI